MVMFIIPKNGVTQQLTSNNSNCLQLTSPVFSVSIFFGRNVPIAYNHQQQLLPPINLPIRCVNPIVDSRIPISRIPCDVNRIPTCCWFVSFLISYHQFHYNDIMSYNITWHHITLHISIYHMYIYIYHFLSCAWETRSSISHPRCGSMQGFSERVAAVKRCQFLAKKRDVTLWLCQHSYGKWPIYRWFTH